MSLPQFSLAVVGAQFPNKDKTGPTRIFELELCQPGELVRLIPEPKNPADPRAIAVFSCRGYQLGYLSAERAPRIGQIIEQGHEVVAIFQERTHFGAHIRVAFDGDEPVLPPAGARASRPAPRVEADEAPDFYPDPEYPDE